MASTSSSKLRVKLGENLLRLTLSRWQRVLNVFAVVVLALDVEALDVILKARFLGLFLPDLCKGLSTISRAVVALY